MKTLKYTMDDNGYINEACPYGATAFNEMNESIEKVYIGSSKCGFCKCFVSKNRKAQEVKCVGDEVVE